MRTVPTLLASLVTAVALSACGSSSKGGASATTAAASASAGASTTAAAAGGATTAAGGAAAAGATITIDSFTYKAPEVAPGATVTVKNDDSVRHTVTADDKSFDVAVGKSATGTFTAPTKAGSYAFHCAVHASMKGTLVVKG